MKIVSKPWGHEEIWAETEKYAGKILVIKAGHQLSLQYHKKKSESCLVLEGCLYLLVNGTEHQLMPGMSYNIKAGAIHRMIAKDQDVKLIEVSTPELDDVVRLEDDYGRKGQ